MQTLNSEPLRASCLTLVLHAAVLGVLSLSWSQAAPTANAPLLIPIKVVSPADLPSAPPPTASQPKPPDKTTAAAQMAAAPKPTAPPPASRALPPTHTRFNPYLLNSAQFNPAIFGNSLASKPVTGAPPVPSTPSYAAPISGSSLNPQIGKPERRVVSRHRARAEDREVIITTYSDGSSTTQTVIDDAGMGRFESTIHSNGSAP